MKTREKYIAHTKPRIGRASCIIGTMAATRKIDANGKLNLVDLTERSDVSLRGERTNIINFLSVFILALRNCITKFNCVARQWAQNKAIIVRTARLKLHPNS
jgi:hypothetical protein